MHSGQQKIKRLVKRLSAMAVQVLFFARYFRVRFFESREEKYRIVAESALPPRLLQKNSFRRRRKKPTYPSRFRHGHYAYKMRSPLFLFFSAHLAQQFPDAVRVRGVRSSVPRRKHARRAAESRHNEPGIIRNNQSLGKAAVVQRLARGIFREGRPYFLKNG